MNLCHQITNLCWRDKNYAGTKSPRRLVGDTVIRVHGLVARCPEYPTLKGRVAKIKLASVYSSVSKTTKASDSCFSSERKMTTLNLTFSQPLRRCRGKHHNRLAKVIALNRHGRQQKGARTPTLSPYQSPLLPPNAWLKKPPAVDVKETQQTQPHSASGGQTVHRVVAKRRQCVGDR